MAGLEAPRNDYGSLAELFTYALEHEKFVSKRIYHLMNIATEEKEHASISFLKWFVDEQREEEKSFAGLLQQVKRLGSDGLYHLDKELGTRVFTPPVID